VAIHRPRGGLYWRYWVVIIGGIVFVVAFYATEGFGLQP
jgi:hypothetical protein